MSSALWDKSVRVLQERIDERSFKALLALTRFHSYENGCLVISVPNNFTGNWIRDRYTDLISSVVNSFAEDFHALSFVPDQTLQKEITSDVQLPPSPQNQPSEPVTSVASYLNSRYTFDEFVVGPSNRFAHAAAKAVCETPAGAYNPLFIYGGAGLGKTHLMQAIGHEILRRRDLKVLYITSEEFTNQLISAIQQRSQLAFRSKYRTVDVLLIDDIHFIAGKDATQEEFFHTFNTLHDAYKQVILSSDRPPKEIPTLEERLVSRFEWGLVTDIQPPDIETRIAILQKKSEKSGLKCPSDMLFFIASLVKANIRELEGTFNRVLGYARAHNCPLTLETAQVALKDILDQSAARQITIEVIQKTTAAHYGIRLADLVSPKRSKMIALSRQVAMYLAREFTQLSLIDIGDSFGGRDHSTVLHACKKVRDMLSETPQFAKDVDAITKQLKST
ncbi:MAG: chromosomal replication initiator protein DnaA [Candidatus Abyssobacteria bacterium SURF_17]|uniref:Chromosomal replication initiator protein DnaA n=1 Tax=Candidatus Abyssobacteria bacterium SURF_17 TaxID=2093361 RepID=A0A419EXG8_9BACT|nr:MAG: chromosomal replication initiator protein DnaA [Candidatus Abyssubacteria bacterium SURF_17]